MYKLFERNEQEDFLKPVMFSISFKHYHYHRTSAGKLETGKPEILFFFGNNGNNLLVNLLKSLSQDIVFCKTQNGLQLSNF